MQFELNERLNPNLEVKARKKKLVCNHKKPL